MSSLRSNNGPRIKYTPEDSPYEAITVDKLTPIIGAEIGDVDLRAPSNRQMDEIHRALAENLVIFFRDQHITPAQHLAFGRRFGELHIHPAAPHEGDDPALMKIYADKDSPRANGEGWHSDVSCDAEPPMGSILYIKQCPPRGGDTLFANQYLVWESLSDAMQGMLRPLRCVNSSAKADVSRTREDRMRGDHAAGSAAEPPRQFAAEHPVARTHPETGRTALYVNIAHSHHFAGMTEAESAPLLGYLFAQQVRPEFTCRFSWAPGSVALWDNRCTLHNPVNDYQGFRRAMHRITLAGDVPI